MSQPRRIRVESGIYRRVDPAGKHLGYELQFKDADGRPRRRSVQGSIHDARNALAESRVRRARRELEPADVRITLGAVINRYEASALSMLRPGTRKVRRAAIARIRPTFGHKRITAVSRADVRGWVAGLIAEGLKANTIAANYSTLRVLYSFAKGDLGIPVSFPKLKPTDLPNPADDQREHRVLSDDELGRVLDAVEDPAWQLYFRTLAETGARASEVLGLVPERIGDGTIRFAAQLGPDGSLAPTKSRHSKRTIEITRGLSAELRLAGSERIFPRAYLRQANRAWHRALKLARLDGPQPVIHDLRHTHASRLIAAGWDPVEIANRLGDRVETILKTYVHEFDARRRSAERRAALEGLYGQDGYQMATNRRSQVGTDGANVQHLRASG